MLGLNEIATAYSYATMVSLGDVAGGIGNFYAGTFKTSIAAMSTAAKLTVVNPVTFGTIIRGFIDGE